MACGLLGRTFSLEAAEVRHDLGPRVEFNLAVLHMH